MAKKTQASFLFLITEKTEKKSSIYSLNLEKEKDNLNFSFETNTI